MSDTEQDVRRRMSDSSSASSADDDSSLANKKTSKAKELDNSGFRVDGEPMNKPRKDDDSSDSDSDSEGGPDNVSEDEEDSSSLSKPAAARKRTVDDSSTESSAPAKSKEVEDEDDSSSETADDVSKSLDDVVDEDEQAPAAVKPVQEIDEEPAEVEAGEPEIEAQASPVASPPVQRVPSVQVNEVDSDSDSEEGPDEADSDKEEEPKEETPAPVVQEEPVKEPEPAVEPEPKPRVNGTEIKRPQFRHSSSSLSDEEIPIAASPAPTAVSPAPAALTSPAPAAAAPAPPPAASVSPVAGSAGLEDRKKEFLAAASSPATPPPPASQSPLPTRANASALTKIYTGAIESNNNESNHNENEKPRSKPAKDITQIYKAGIANKTATPPSSPKPVPSRNRDITQLYTGGFQKGQNNKNSASPCMAADKLNPSKHNMSTAVDRDAIRQAYDDVRSDTSDTQWAVFKFDESNRLKAAGTGKDFKDFKGSFSNEDRGFGYIRINTGDEMSKRAKFVFVTWVGPSVSVMKKAKMSTDKALMKDIIQNMSVELQFENHAEFSQDFFKSQVDKAAGARYGTGERAL